MTRYSLCSLAVELQMWCNSRLTIRRKSQHLTEYSECVVIYYFNVIRTVMPWRDTKIQEKTAKRFLQIEACVDDKHTLLGDSLRQHFLPPIRTPRRLAAACGRYMRHPVGGGGGKAGSVRYPCSTHAIRMQESPPHNKRLS